MNLMLVEYRINLRCISVCFVESYNDVRDLGRCERTLRPIQDLLYSSLTNFLRNILSTVPLDFREVKTCVYFLPPFEEIVLPIFRFLIFLVILGLGLRRNMLLVHLLIPFLEKIGNNGIIDPLDKKRSDYFCYVKHDYR